MNLWFPQASLSRVLIFYIVTKVWYNWTEHLSSTVAQNSKWQSLLMIHLEPACQLHGRTNYFPLYVTTLWFEWHPLCSCQLSTPNVSLKLHLVTTGHYQPKKVFTIPGFVIVHCLHANIITIVCIGQCPNSCAWSSVACLFIFGLRTLCMYWPVAKCHKDKVVQGHILLHSKKSLITGPVRDLMGPRLSPFGCWNSHSIPRLVRLLQWSICS